MCGQHPAVATVSTKIHVTQYGFESDSDTIERTILPMVTFPFFTPNGDSG